LAERSGAVAGKLTVKSVESLTLEGVKGGENLYRRAGEEVYRVVGV
jgi:hypothetical protein